MYSHHQSQMIEALEARCLLSAELLQSGELLIIGTSGADAITVEAGLADGQVALSGVAGVADGTVFDGVTSLNIRTGDGRDIVDVQSGLRDAQGANIPAMILGGRARDRLLGGDGDDVIRGGGGPDFIRGRVGDDVLKGNAGDDLLRGSRGNDRLVGGEGNDFLRGDNDDDRLFGNPGDDRVDGGRGDDRLVGGGGDDVLNGGVSVGNDLIEGGPGDDQLSGEGGDDLLKGGRGNDVLSGDDGNDELRGNAGHDDLSGGRGIDVLFGGDGSDVLAGGEDTDLVTGGRGDDIFRSPFSERQDFSTNDQFFSDEAGRGEEFAILNDAFWDKIDIFSDLITDLFGDLVADAMWLGVDGAQKLLATSGIHEDAFVRLRAELSNREAIELDTQLSNLVIGFLFDIGSDLEDLSTVRIFELFDDLQALDLNAPMQAALGSFVTVWRNNEADVDNVVRGLITLGDPVFRQAPFFRDALGDFLLNLWPI